MSPSLSVARRYRRVPNENRRIGASTADRGRNVHSTERARHGSERRRGEPLAVLKVREVAALLRMDVKAIYAEIQAGRLKAIRVGRSLRVPRAAIAALFPR